MISEYSRYDALGLAELVRKGKVSAPELLDEAIRRTEALNPRLGAVVFRMYEHARELAGAPLPEGPFTGVPFLTKEILQAYAGFPLSSGSRALLDYIPPADAEVVARFKRAGVVTFGKTNVPEFGLMAYTEPEAFGPARNPWNLDHTPGGSSGGAAAAVAAGLVPLAGANDGGGSIRIPASACGLFGLKPTRGRVPTGPLHGEVWEGAAVDHVLTRSVRDSAAMLDAIAGPYVGAPYQIPAPERPYAEEIARAPGPLRVAFSTASPLGNPVDHECVRATEDAARLLEELGHEVERAEPAVDGMRLARAYLTLYFGQVAADQKWLIAERGRGALRKLETTTRALGLLGRSLSSGDYVLMRRSWNDFARATGAFHQRYDIYMTPVMAAPPARIGELKPTRLERIALQAAGTLRLGKLLLRSGLIDKLAHENLSRTPFTQLANLTGQPAMSVPLHWTPGGLPVGVQFTARWGDEGTLFRLAAQLEEARPWRGRWPELAEAVLPNPTG
jgi:amidase